jgi:YD repeat-containing protein
VSKNDLAEFYRLLSKLSQLSATSISPLPNPAKASQEAEFGSGSMTVSWLPVLADYTYDSLGDATSTTNSDGPATAITYDMKQRPIHVSYPDGNCVICTYDAVGNLSTMRDSNGWQIYGYDALGRLTSVTYSPTDNVKDPTALLIGYHYDLDNRLTELAYPNCGKKATYSYDAAGNLTSIAEENDGQTSRVTTYTYSSTNELLTSEVPWNNTETLYTYDSAGQQIIKSNGNGTYTTYAHDCDGKRMKVMDACGNVTEYYYEALNRSRDAHADHYTWATNYAFGSGEDLASETINHTRHSIAETILRDHNNRRDAEVLPSHHLSMMGRTNSGKTCVLAALWARRYRMERRYLKKCNKELFVASEKAVGGLTASLRKRLGLDTYMKGETVDSVRSSRFSPSIITRSEALLFGDDYPRFAIRVYLDNGGSFINVRPRSEIAKREYLHVRDLVIFDNSLQHLGECDVEPIADGVLVPPDSLQAVFEILTADFGGIYGETTAVRGTPYVRGLRTLGGAACAQACLFMASAILHDRVGMAAVGARIHGLAEMDALVQGSERAKSRLSGMTMSDMVRYLEITGKSGSVQEVGLGSAYWGSVHEFSQRIRSYLLEGYPVIAIVNAEKLRGLGVPNARKAGAEVGHANHVVLVVGVSKTTDELLINDPAGKPFTRVSASDLFAASLTPQRVNRWTSRFIPVAPARADDRSRKNRDRFPVPIQARGDSEYRRLKPALTSSFRYGASVETISKWWPDLDVACCLVVDDSIDQFVQCRDSLNHGSRRVSARHESGLGEAGSGNWLNQVVALKCYAGGLTRDEAIWADSSVEGVCRAISLARMARRHNTTLRSRDVLPIVLAVGSRIERIQISGRSEHGKSLFLTERPTGHVLEVLMSRLERIVRHAGLKTDEGISLAIELEPGPLYAINKMSTLQEMAARLTRNPLLSKVVGFNLDFAHFTLAGITPCELAVDDAVCSRITHACFSDVGPGNFGNLALGEGSVGSNPGDSDKLAVFKEWVTFLEARLLKAPEASRVVAFSPHVSLELEAAGSMSWIMSSIATLRRLIGECARIG